jgi:hypothetical protein
MTTDGFKTYITNPGSYSPGAGTVQYVIAGTGLNGGTISVNGTISIANTGVSSGTYGSSSTIPIITINSQGQITSAINTSFTVFTSGTISSGGLQFTPQGTNPSTSTGLTWYDSAKDSLSYFNSTGYEINLGQQVDQVCYNNTGSTIPAGTAVYLSGGSNGAYPYIAPAIATSTSNANMVGITGQNITNGATGVVVILGEIFNYNTTGWSAGQTLYLSSGTAGALTTTQPTSPYYAVRAGFVVTGNSSSGIIFVSVRNVYTLGSNIISPVSLTAFSTSSSPLILYGYSSGQIADLFDVYTYNGGTKAFSVNNAGTTILGTPLPVGSGGTGISSVPSNGQIPIGNGTLYSANTLTAGSGISITNAAGSITIAASGAGSGTVTSVQLSGGATGLTASGGPITTAGTISLGGTLAVGAGGTGLVSSPSNGQLLIGNGSSYSLNTLTADTTLNITNTAGSITLGINLNNRNTWTNTQTFSNAGVSILGSSTGATVFSSANSSATNYTLTLPATTGTLTVLGNTSTGSGAVVLANSPTLITPSIGSATATAINNTVITNPGTVSGTLAIASGSTLATAGAYSTTLTSIGPTNVTLPTTGTLAIVGSTVASFSGGSTGLTPSSATTGAVTLGGTLAVAYGGTGVTTSTGSGSVVLSNTPTLTTPNIGNASGSALNLSGTISASAIATGSTTAITLANWFAATITAASFGAVGDGTTDDTAALQAAINATSSGGFVELYPGKTYLVTNLTLNSVYSSSGQPMSGLFSRGGMATIKKKSGVQNGYLVGTHNWVNNVAAQDYPVQCENIVFDGASIAGVTVANMSFFSVFRNCWFINATSHGHRLAKTMLNGSVGAVGVNNRFHHCYATGNTSDGIHIDTNGATDTQIDGGIYAVNGSYNIYLGNAAGVLLSNVHCYQGTTGDLWASNYGFGTSCTGNYFESPVVIDSLGTDAIAIFGSGNIICSTLTVNFTDNIAYEAFRSVGNTYQQAGQIVQGYNGAQHTVYSTNDVYYAAVPFQWSGGTGSAGQIVAQQCYVYLSGYGATGSVMLDGLQTPATANIAPNRLDFTKPLSTSGTSTTLTITATVANGVAVSRSGFNLSGKINVWSLNSTSTTQDSFSCDLIALYSRFANTTSSIKSAILINSFSVNGTISAAVAIADVTSASAPNTVTITITITAPQSSSSYASGASVHFFSENRDVTSLYVA